MARIMCYGEDGLTLAAVTEHLGCLLKILKDDSNTDECLVLYRPSFGRNGGVTRASFGEFDAILATKKSVYLIESKWIRSRTTNQTIKLKKNQTRRHEIFEWIRSSWKKENNWAQFREEYAEEFKDTFEKKPLASNTSKLGNNLEQILNLLLGYPKTIQHIVLAFYRDNRHEPTRVEDGANKFILKKFPYKEFAVQEVFQLRLTLEKSE